MTKSVTNIGEINKKLNDIVQSISSGTLRKTMIKESILIGKDLDAKLKSSKVQINDLNKIIPWFENISDEINNITIANSNELEKSLNYIICKVEEDFKVNYSDFKNCLQDKGNNFSEELKISGDLLSKEFYEINNKLKNISNNCIDNINNINKNSKVIVHSIDNLNNRCNDTCEDYKKVNVDVSFLENIASNLDSKVKNQFSTHIKEFKDFTINNYHRKLDSLIENDMQIIDTIESIDKKLEMINLKLHSISNPLSDEYRMLNIKKLAKQGNVDKQFELAMMYENNNQKDKAIKWYIKAAENNHPSALQKIRKINKEDKLKEIKKYIRSIIGD